MPQNMRYQFAAFIERAGLMIDRIDEFLSQANGARERADIAEGDFKRQWLKVAEMWELLAKEYKRIRDGAADG